MSRFTFNNKIRQHKRGVTIFFAILIIGVLLGIGASIASISQKQISLSSLGKQSELAFYSADSAIECVQYWDKNYAPTSNPLDSDYTGGTSGAIGCNNVAVTVCDNNNLYDPVTNPTGYEACSSPSRIFTINTGTICANITVEKDVVSGVTVTTITARGYNTCVNNASNKLERAIQVIY